LLGEFVIPLELLPPFSFSAGLWGGLFLSLCGMALEIAAARELHASGTTTRPHAKPSHLVTTGAFRRSRNPFYIGLLLTLAGLMLVLSLDWIVLAVPMLWLGLDRLVVPAEEVTLHEQFGSSWNKYAARTRRWL
jgi:protein-S-isoprenylcysteine O-methyltransferase Ste14